MASSLQLKTYDVSDVLRSHYVLFLLDLTRGPDTFAKLELDELDS